MVEVGDIPKDFGKGGKSINHFIPLSDGHFLLTYSDGVAEIDSLGRTVWKNTLPPGENGFAPLARLRNGNLLIDDGKVMVEIDDKGKPVWEFVFENWGAIKGCLNLVRLGLDLPRPAGWRVDSWDNRLRQLRHPEPRVRARAAADLARAWPQKPEIIPAIIEAFDDPVAEVNTELAETLGHLGPKVLPYLMRALENPRMKIRAGAVFTLGHFPEEGEKIVPFLVKALRDENWLVRWEAARTLRFKGLKAEVALPGLVKALRDENWLVRQEATSSLGYFGPQAAPALPDLVRALKDKNRKVAEQAAWALSFIGPQAASAVPELMEAVKIFPREPEDKLQEMAIWALGRIGPGAGKAVPFLVQALQSPEYQKLHLLMAESLFEITPLTKANISIIVNSFRKVGNKFPYGMCFILLLERIGPEATRAAIPELTASLTSDHPTTVEVAARALGKLGPAAQEAIPALIEALKVPNRYPRSLASARDVARVEVAKALGSMGRLAKPALPALKEAAALQEGRWIDEDEDEVLCGELWKGEKWETKFRWNPPVPFQAAVREAIQKIEEAR